jgi:hypothetical protein
MSTIILRYGFLILASLLFASFRWPVDEGTITSTFCESRWDHFHDGIDMVSVSDRVYPVEGGTLLFYWDRAIFPLENYPGGGNYKVLEHAKGLCSVYMHLDNGVPSKRKYAADEPVGTMGNTGHSNKKHIHFSLINIRSKSSINPFIVLPPYSDLRPPEIKDIAFKIGEKYVIVRDKSNIRLTRHYPLLIRITDSVSGRESLGIYRLSVVFNEKEVMKYKCDRLVFLNGQLTVEKKGFDDLYDKKGYYKIGGLTYNDGPNILKINASDYAGNLVEKEYTFNVKLDIVQ